VAVRIGLAEHDVVRALFGREHGVVTGIEAAASGDAVGLERRQRLGERFRAGQVRAVGAAACDQVGVTVENEGRVMALRHGRELLDAVDEAPLVARRQPDKHGRDVTGGQCGLEDPGERIRTLDRGRHEVKARLRPRLGMLRAGGHGPRMIAQSGGRLTGGIGRHPAT